MNKYLNLILLALFSLSKIAFCEAGAFLTYGGIMGSGFNQEILLTKNYVIKQLNIAQDSSEIDSTYFEKIRNLSSHLKSASCKNIMDGMYAGIKIDGTRLQCSNCTICDSTSENSKNWARYFALFNEIDCRMDYERIRKNKIRFADSIKISMNIRRLKIETLTAKFPQSKQDSTYLDFLTKDIVEIQNGSKKSCKEFIK